MSICNYCYCRGCVVFRQIFDTKMSNKRNKEIENPESESEEEQDSGSERDSDFDSDGNFIGDKVN